MDFKLELNKEGSHHIFFSKSFILIKSAFVLTMMTCRIFGGTLVIVRGGKKFLIDESKQKLYQVMQVSTKKHKMT